MEQVIQTPLIVSLERLRVTSYCYMASFAVLVFDYCLMFDQEVSLVWYSQWNHMEFLFLATRYLPFVDVSLAIWYMFGPNIHDCRIIFTTIMWLVIIGAFFAEAVLSLRTWAVWKESRGISIIIPTFFVLAFVAEVLLSSILSHSMNYSDLPLLHKGCIIPNGILAYKQGGRSELSDTVYRDGTMYYFYLFVLALLNVILVESLPTENVTILIMIERVMHSIFAYRVVLRTRQVASDNKMALRFNRVR